MLSSSTVVPLSLGVKMATAFLWLQALLFIACGLIGLINPVGLLSSMGIAFETPVAVTEIRATYGGFLLGAGLFILYSAFRDVSIGLVSVALLLAGAGFTRGAGMLVDGGVSAMQWTLLVVELVSVAAAIYLRRFITVEK